MAVIKTARDATVNATRGLKMLNEDKIPVALEAIWESLERIAHALEIISDRGISIRQLSPDCMNNDHGNDFGGCNNCGCKCHD